MELFQDQLKSRAEGNSLSIKDSKPFGYNTNIAGKLEGSNATKDVKNAVSLKQLSNFWRALDMQLVNCEVSLTLTRSVNSVQTSKMLFSVIIQQMELIVQQVQHLK